MMETSRRQRKAVKKLQQQSQVTQDGVRAQVIYSGCYTVGKPDSEARRLLHNLKLSGANLAAWIKSHKQDGVQDLRGMIRPGDRFVQWDLKEAFHQILVHPTMQSMLRAMIYMLKTR